MSNCPTCKRPIQDIHRCTYIYQRGPDTGKVCNHIIRKNLIYNKDLCYKHIPKRSKMKDPLDNESHRTIIDGKQTYYKGIHPDDVSTYVKIMTNNRI